MRVATIVVFVGVAACGGGGGSPSTPDASIDANVPTRTVSGLLHHLHVEPDGTTVDVPVNLTGVSIRAFSPPSFQAYPGSGLADGTFSIVGVPVGTYELQVGARYFVRTADTIDLSFAMSGRQGVDYATISPTNLILNLDGLASWQTGDELEMIAPNSGTAAFDLQDLASAGAPAANATTLTGLTYDLSQAPGPALVEGSNGDTLTIDQLAMQTAGYATVARTFTAPLFTMTNGAPTTLTGSFTTVDPTSTLGFTWDRSAFAAELAAHSPRDSSYNWSELGVSALPAAAANGFYDAAAQLVTYRPDWTLATSAMNLTWPYGDPLPPAWTRIAWVELYADRSVQLGNAAPIENNDSVQSFVDLSTLSAQAPLEPIVGTVVSPQIDGQDAFGAITNLSATPTITWSAPTLGTATDYLVWVTEVKAVSGQTTLTDLANFDTTDTSLTLPSGTLAPGHSYVLEIDSRSDGPGVDLATTPNGDRLPEGLSVVTTSLLTP